MNIENQIMNEFSLLTTEDKHYMLKVVCLLNFCPGFSKEMNGIMPTTGEAATPELLSSTAALMDKWLYKEGYAGLVRAKLASVGVEV